MYMIPYPRRSNSSMMDLFDELERSMFGESGRRTPVFSTDIRDEGAHYLLQADLPGFRKEDIDLDVKDGVLTISAKHQADDRTAADNYICRERRTGSFCQHRRAPEENPKVHPVYRRQKLLAQMLQKGRFCVPASCRRSFPSATRSRSSEVSPAAVRRSRYAGSA